MQTPQNYHQLQIGLKIDLFSKHFMYLPNLSAMSRMHHKVNLLTEYIGVVRSQEISPF